MRDLTAAEREVAVQAGALACLHAMLPVVHPSDQADIVFHVHAIQNIVFARPQVQHLRDKFPEYGNDACGHT